MEADLLRLAVIKRPEGAVGAAIFGRQPAMQVDDAQAAFLQVLDGYRLADLVQDRSALDELLARTLVEADR